MAPSRSTASPDGGRGRRPRPARRAESGSLEHLQPAAAYPRRDGAASAAFRRLMDETASACAFIKLFSNETRLQILCALAEGDKSVGELEMLLNVRQPALSQQLARLRAEDVVDTRRAGKRVIYALASDRVRAVVKLVYETFCLDGCEEAGCAVQRIRR